MKRILLLAALAGTLLAPGAAQAGTLDQQQTTVVGPTAAYVSSGILEAQTFTAGLTGNLDQVDLYLQRGSLTSTALTVQIRTVTGGVPSGVVKATATTPASSVAPSGSWVAVPIGPTPVIATAKYAIVLSSTEAYYWGGTPTDTYALGQMFGLTGAQSWQASSSFLDLAFKTYVDTTTPVSFRSVSAVRTSSGVVLHWRTASEIDTLGFNIYRQVNGRRVRVNSKLISAANRDAGRTYSFLDRTAPTAKSLCYWIQVVSLDGLRSWYGPARVMRSG